MKDMMEAKRHVEALKMMAEEKGISLNDLMSQVGMEDEEGEEKEMPEQSMMGEDEEEEEEKAGPDRNKIALIIAKMKNGKKE